MEVLLKYRGLGWRVSSARRIKVGDVAGRPEIAGGYWRIHILAKGYPRIGMAGVFGVWPKVDLLVRPAI